MNHQILNQFEGTYIYDLIQGGWKMNTVF